ncbi:MAG: hypothetical protein NUW24_06435 [Anaerolineae bacterium]|nr:hypothetical protein [Anaerolineae bacterium]MDH7472573.1 hypothetical protein [Anaerolineae bacterium]
MLGLLVLVALVIALALTLRGQQGESVAFQSPLLAATPTLTLNQAFESPIETPTRRPIPTIPPTVTRAPKPTEAPTPTPTITPVPTALPLPPSAFYALWAESFPLDLGQPWGVLWLADPRDIGSRQEVVRFEGQEIFEVAVSPDGRKLALVTVFWKTSTLWVANVDGTGLQQLDRATSLGGLFWGRDNHSLVYSIGWREDVMMPGGYEETVWRSAVELLDTATGEKRQLLEPELDVPLNVLGWSADGRELYYMLGVSQEIGYEYELRAVDRSTRSARKIAPLGSEPGLPILSPDGSKLLISTPEGVAWISADGKERGSILEQGHQAFWGPEVNEVIVGQVDEKEPLYHLQSINIHTQIARDLATFAIPGPGGWRPLALSSDRQWLAAYLYQTGLYWIHLPTGTMVPVPSQDRRVIFVAWVPRGTAEQ